jgi:hypothetical protein
MYEELFTKLGLEKKTNSSLLQGFNRSTTRMGLQRNTCYTLAAVEAVPSTVHLKMEYHDAKNKVVTIEVDFDRSQKTSRDPLEEINVAIGEGGSKSDAGKDPPTKKTRKSQLNTLQE